MGYSVYYDFAAEENFENKSLEVFLSDDEKVIQSEEFEYFYEDYKDAGDDSLTEEENKLQFVEKFKESDSYYELEEEFFPLVNYVHIVQNAPTDDEVKLVNEYASNCVVVFLEKLDTFGIALAACGADFSSSIELAYYIIDGRAPMRSKAIAFLGEEAEALLKFCRYKRGVVPYSEIIKFLEEYKQS